MVRSTRQAAHEGSDTERRAVAYVRMSTEHQQYSTENQLDVIRVFAETRDLEVVRVYADEGKAVYVSTAGIRLRHYCAMQSQATRTSPSYWSTTLADGGDFRTRTKVPATRFDASMLE